MMDGGDYNGDCNIGGSCNGGLLAKTMAIVQMLVTMVRDGLVQATRMVAVNKKSRSFGSVRGAGSGWFLATENSGQRCQLKWWQRWKGSADVHSTTRSRNTRCQS